MNNKIMEKATFKEICKFMKGNKTDIQECILEVLGVPLLFLPGLICKDVAMLANIANGVSLITAKEEINKSIKYIYNTFNNKEYIDFSTKYEHAQIAHILIVFASYFDSIKMYLPNEERVINLSAKEKYMLTDEGLRKYGNYLQNKLADKANARAREIFESDLSMPNPIESIRGYLDRLKKFYDLLNQEFIGFFEKLYFWEHLEENKKDIFLSIIRAIPVKAVEIYQKQYYELSIKFNDFFIWGNIQEHKEIKQSIDVGFEQISRQIVTYYENFKNEKAKEILEKYQKKYLCNTKESIIDTAEMDSVSAENMVFPTKKDIFLPQSFQALLYKNNMHLEHDAWRYCEERQNIGKFISDTLRHPVLGQLPLLILGLPGSGKTLLCNMLAAKILFHEYHVIIIKLRDTIADETISQQISQQMKRDFSNACTWDDIAESGINKPVLLIFDGYDELLQASGRTHSDYIKKIFEFQKNQKNIYNIFVKCIITSRTILIDKALIAENTPVIKLCDFDEQRIEAWSAIWNQKNECFFNKNGLEIFEIDKDSKVYELAKQPLLLLMLALYDSNDNALKKQKNINSTQLYYKLIWEFVSREKKKNYKFRSKQEFEQQKIIDKEIRKISIAALGMYNRKTLYIRSTELQSDIEFIEQKEQCGDELSGRELKESDKLLGNFLFIHKSKSTDIIEKEKNEKAAYEFLHNTFGEFLIAYFVVCETFNILEWTRLLLKQNMGNQWVMPEQRAWYISLVYAPLFSRPVVVKMIYEWSITYLENKGITKDEINESMNFFINAEIKKIIKGDTISILKDIIEKKRNPFTQDEILKHLAIYSLNIIMIRTVIYTNKHIFQFESENVWNKLVCLWKYAFSDSDFADYSNIFMVDPEGNSCLMTYNYDDKKQIIQQNKISRLFNSYLAIGDELTSTLIGVLVGNNKKDKIIEVIYRKSLNIKARYMWNFILNSITDIDISQDYLITMLREFRIYCWNEGDMECIFSYYLLVEFLLKEKRIDNKNKYVKRFLLQNVVLGERKLDYLYESFTLENGLACCIVDVFLNILNYMNMDINDIEKLFQIQNYFKICCVTEVDRYGYSNGFILYYLVRFYNIIIKILMNYKKDFKRIKLIIREIYFESFLDRLIWESKKRRCSKYTNEILELFYNFIVLQKQQINKKIFKTYIDLLKYMDLHNKNIAKMDQKINIIKCLYMFYQKDCSIVYKYLPYITSILQGISLKEVFRVSEEAAFYLCCLTETEEFIDRITLRDDLMWIVNRKGKYISVAFYR